MKNDEDDHALALVRALAAEVRRLRRIEAAARAYLAADEDTEEQHPTLGTVRVSASCDDVEDAREALAAALAPTGPTAP